ASSGVDNNTVQYSTDGSQWTTLSNTAPTSFSATWNTTTFSNNQSVTLQARAYDIIGNTITAKINVTVDNEIPELKIISPSPATLAGNVQLQLNVSDYYGGVDLANVRYTVGSLSGALGCTGTKWNATCTALLATSSLSDGNYSLNFIVTDVAGNSRNASVEIKTKNTQPTITILEPANKAFIKGTVLIRTTLANTEGSVNSVEVSLENLGNTTTKTMSCNANFTACNYSLDTTSFPNDGYTIKAKAINSLNADVSSSITATIDNKKPSVTITQPTADVKGDFEMKADVVDDNVDKNKVTFALSSSTGSLTCTTQTPSKLTCSTTFNSKQLTDGKYFLNISAEDKAGNSFTSSKEISIVNQQTTTGSPGSTSPQATAETTEETTNEEKTPKGMFNITLPFKPEYVILGVIISSVLVIVVILAIVAKNSLGKNIITE
ncbi:MAG: Ig-like domain-containing protein, partial [Candidatus Aenigmatarchaeota archaeon]